MSTITNSSDVTNDTAQTNPQPVPQKNALALEFPVTVSGTRPTDGDTRGLFTEESSTVLVFEQGAVIRLAADVAVGQLLFVTDKKTRREVVCQVVQKRTSQPANNYVEVEFTEQIDNFWGDAFPAGPKREPPAKRSVGGAIGKRTQNLHSPVSPAPRSNRPKNDVAAQMLQLLDLPGEEASAIPAADASKRAPQLDAPVKLPAQFMIENWKKTLQEEIAPDPETHKDESDEALLPVPDLQFPETAVEAADQPATEQPATKPSRKPRVAILSALLLAAFASAAVAWYQNLLPFLPRNGATTIASAIRDARAKVTGEKASAPAKNPGNASRPAAPAKAPTPAPSGESAPSLAAQPQPPVTDSKSPEAAPQPGAPSPEKNQKPQFDKAAERKAPESSATAPPPAEQPPSEENLSSAELVAPRLLKSVNPEYPEDAMRGYVTGDVRVEATVDAHGRVHDAKALLGPAILRAAAVDAVKRYEYAPATRGGKAVEATVTVMVKFWFNP